MLSPMDGWELFGARVKREMDDRRPPWTPDRVYKETKKLGTDDHGVGPGTLANWIAGNKPKRMDRVYLLCDLFDWSHESVDIMRQGGEPVYVGGGTALPADVIAAVDGLATAIEDAASSIRRMLAQVDQSIP